MSVPFKVAVRSDDGMFRDGLAAILRGVPSIVVAGDGADGQDSDVDVLLLDSRMHDALRLCSAITKAAGPDVVFVVAPNDEEWAREALGAGARGILPKSARPEQVIAALRIVIKGLIWAPRSVMVATIDHLTQTAAVRGARQSILEQRLSAREREVFHHAAAGMANKELADRLDISEATVKVHLTHIFQKLGLRCRAELAAAYHGVIHHGQQRPNTT